ncbi:hypothetical protein HK102_004743, partial [Quaeritorhiza haematococci]
MHLHPDPSSSSSSSSSTTTATRAIESNSNSSNAIYKARDLKSKEKCAKFFGETAIPMLVGSGSARKLHHFY